MLQESNEEISELDVELKTWYKLEKNMKTIGFLDGVEKGKELSLQEGLDLGFSDGFKLGECFGLIKGVICYESETQLSPTKESHSNEEDLNNLLKQICVMCTAGKSHKTLDEHELTSEKSVDLLSTQQSHIKKLTDTLRSEFESHKENG